MENISPSLLATISDLVSGPEATEAKLTSICRILKEQIAHYDWVGFYLVDETQDNQLILGPFAGAPTEHTQIAFGEGICGQAATTQQTFLIQDVSRETNYLSCSPHVKSEIVLPIFKEGILVGELDIDSHVISPFTQEDTALLEHVCSLVTAIF